MTKNEILANEIRQHVKIINDLLPVAEELNIKVDIGVSLFSTTSYDTETPENKRRIKNRPIRVEITEIKFL